MTRILRTSPLANVLDTCPPCAVLGLDPSLNSTGFAYRVSIAPDGERKLYTGCIAPGTLRGPNRLAYVRNRLMQVLDAAQPALAVYEDYAMGARGNNAYHMGEMGGVLKTLLWERGIDVLLVSPSALKKILVGRGNADSGRNGKHKPEMRAAILSKLGYALDQNDEADAFGLMVLGELRMGSEHAALSPGQVKALRLDALSEYTLIKGKPQRSVKPPK